MIISFSPHFVKVKWSVMSFSDFCTQANCWVVVVGPSLPSTYTLQLPTTYTTLLPSLLHVPSKKKKELSQPRVTSYLSVRN